MSTGNTVRERQGHKCRWGKRGDKLREGARERSQGKELRKEYERNELGEGVRGRG